MLPKETDEEGRFAELAYRLESHSAVDEVHRRTDGDFPEACIHYDADQATLDQLLELARSTGADVRDRYKPGEWFVRGMDAPQCGRVIEYSLDRMEGVLQADVAYGAERLVLEYDSDLIDEDDIEDRVKALGYHLDPIEQQACQHHHHAGSLGAKLQMPLVAVSGILIAVGFGLEMWASTPEIVSTVLYAIALVAGGFFSLKGALHSVRQFRFDIETLMILSGAGAALLGAWLEGAFLLFLFSLGHALEHKAMSRARNALNALGKLRPETARIFRDGDFVEVPVSEVRRGDRMQVRPGDRVALDGTIVEGASSLDESAVTGESIPVSKASGDEVFAGTVNADSAIEVDVAKLSSESVISRVVDMVAKAEARKSPTQRFTQTLEEKFVPIVLVAAIVYPAILYFATDAVLQDAVLRGVSLLVAASPCALAISVPAAVLSSVAAAAKKGILIKGGVHLEELGKTKAMAFDKTGTLTEGKPRLTEVVTAEGVDEDQLLTAAATGEALSSHPLARAVLDGVADRGIDVEQADEMESIHGKGIRAVAGDSVIRIGNAALFDGTVPEALAERMEQLHAGGQTTMVVCRDDRFLGVIAVADTLRPEAADMIASIKRMGVDKTMLLTGDNARVAQAIGEAVGIDEIHGPLLPEQKVATMKRLARDSHVAMTGDGVNDAPALASASVGVAMGGAGTDVALETADIVLMADKLTNLPEALSLSRQATRIIKQNLVIALGVSALLVAAVIAGWAQVSEAIVLHEGSTIVVALNGIRMLRA